MWDSGLGANIYTNLFLKSKIISAQLMLLTLYGSAMKMTLFNMAETWRTHFDPCSRVKHS